MENTRPEMFKDVKVFFGDNFWQPAGDSSSIDMMKIMMMILRKIMVLVMMMMMRMMITLMLMIGK